MILRVGMTGIAFFDVSNPERFPARVQAGF